ncbi:uncharacterized protein [Haliotis cracherodii]|uniref:uncharacterized protein n=1 Tax=Haliotis cracherodii TaxID=6455 RepID=UPI0039ED6ABD
MGLRTIYLVLSFAILMIQGEITLPCPCARMRTTPVTEQLATTESMKDVVEPKRKWNLTFSDRPPLLFVGLEGETHEFLCSGESSITMATTTWQVPNHVTISMMNDTSSYRSGVFITPNNSLVLYKMSTNHRGRYICRLSFDDVIAEAPMQLMVVEADMRKWTLRVIIGAASLAGFLVTYAVVHLGYKVYLCKASGQYLDPDFGAQVPLRQL